MTRAEAEALIAALVLLRESATDEQALTVPALYPTWRPGMDCKAGNRVQHRGVLYKVLQAHTSQADWMPDATPALWVVVSIAEYPEWVQPTGAHDAYNTGDKVSYKGKHYVCTADANVYAPGVYGWEET